VSVEKSLEQEARDLIEACGYDDAQNLSAGDVVVLAQHLAELHKEIAFWRELLRKYMESVHTAEGLTFVDRRSQRNDAVRYRRLTAEEHEALIELAKRDDPWVDDDLPTNSADPL